MDDKCPHCGSSPLETWFDRTDVEGMPYETYPYRCCNCGKNVDAPVEYYKETEIEPNYYKTLLEEAGLILEALNMSVQWESSPEMKHRIAKLLRKIRKIIGE